MPFVVVYMLHAAVLHDRELACLNGYPSVTREFRESQRVFVGTVVAGHYEPPLDRYFDQDGTTYDVRVEEPIKGPLPRLLQLFSENSSGRFPMVVGRKYLLFVYPDHGRLLVDNCGNSERFSARSKTFQQVQKLARPRK